MKSLLLISLLLLSGCASVTVKTPDCEAYYYTIFKDMDAGNFTVCGGAAEVVGTSSKTELFQLLLEMAQ